MDESMTASDVFSLAFFFGGEKNFKSKQNLNTFDFRVLRIYIKPGKRDTCLMENH